MVKIAREEITESRMAKIAREELMELLKNDWKIAHVEFPLALTPQQWKAIHDNQNKYWGIEDSLTGNAWDLF